MTLSGALMGTIPVMVKPAFASRWRPALSPEAVQRLPTMRHIIRQELEVDEAGAA